MLQEMADTSHLERMGRELNCPICLSLLDSAVSLTCNHVFCNSCIMKSMKLGSNCPVCKVPYQRREVRPVPHMDNLVNIYKSMEAASGLNIFVTQNAPSTKLSDKQQTEGDQHCKGQKADIASEESAKNQRKRKGKGPKGLLKTNPKDSGPKPAKPSFPGKKRIQVPQYPLSETPEQPAKLEGDLNEIGKGGPKINSVVLKQKPALNDNGEMMFSPFFWLREDEDEENSSQQMDGDLALSSSLPKVPSFSDIKGSDDEMPSELTPKGKLDTEFNVGYTFDSEIFEWTQRACSPELCSSPMKMLVPDSQEIRVQKEEDKPVLLEAITEKGTRRTENLNCKDGEDFVAARLSTMSSPKIKNAVVQNGLGKPKKRGRKANKKGQRKCSKKGAGENLRIHISSESLAGDFIAEQASVKDGSLPVVRKKTDEACKMDYVDNSIPDAAPGNVSVLSVEAKSLNQGDENAMTASTASLGRKHECGGSLSRKHERDGSLNLKKRGRGCDNVKVQSNKDRVNQKLESAEDMFEKDAIMPNQITYDMLSNSHCVSLTVDDDGEVPGLEKASKHDGVISKVNQMHDKKLRPSKKLKVSMDNVTKYGLINDTQEGNTNVSTQSTQPIDNNQHTPKVGVLDSSTSRKVLSVTNREALRKSESIPNKISCAFCHSAEESEASGEMVHYLNGRPVAADNNGSSSIIHSHRKCTEWAPNVYFEDGSAVNLKAELARSRRITCCCCGIKGAALGCYEKSCRKSFHFTCAKLTPECRWDTDNFVMLCPFHASSKLPNEFSKLPPKARKKCSPKGQSCMQQTQAVVKQDVRTIQRWSSCASLGKLVLCCSALTVTEKEIVSEFERLSGVTVLMKWGPGITHVIASTDENGACRRTLKFLMGILEGKWILSIEWIKACMKANEPVAEEQYEVGIDIHGIRDGPRLGRFRLLNEQPKLFNGFKFYFFGHFMPSYKGYLQDLAIAAGGTVLHRKPIMGNQETPLAGFCHYETFIIYSLELPDNCRPDRKDQIFACRRSEAEALARLTGAKVASNSWFLNSIAACQVQNVAD